MQIAILTQRNESLHAFATGLGAVQDWLDNAQTALELAKTSSWDLLVVDAAMPGLEYKSFIMKLLQTNAMINTAVITDQPDSIFHQESEGLGVLCAIPSPPAQADGAAVAHKLKSLLGLS